MTPRAAAGERLRRVLALVPYIADRGDVTLTELAEAFGAPEDVIEHDLEILPFCGLPPYTPDRLIDVALIDGHVSIRFAEYFARPLRLTPAEGFTLLAAGRALLDVAGSDPDGSLASALSKLEAALGAHEVVDVDIGQHEYIDRLRRAAEHREQLEIDYYSFGRDVTSTRRIDPYDIVNLRGHWYLAAWCHQAQDDRLFRVDRIRDVRETGETFEERSRREGVADVFSPGPGDVRVVLDLPPDAEWVVESYPTEALERRRDGSLRITLVASATPWLERLLLRVGPTARLVEPSEWATLGAEAARRVLERYGEAGGTRV